MSATAPTNSLRPPAAPIEAPAARPVSPVFKALIVLIAAIAAAALGFLLAGPTGAAVGVLAGAGIGFIASYLIPSSQTITPATPIEQGAQPANIAGAQEASPDWQEYCEPELLLFYQQNGVINDYQKPLEVDFDLLGLNLEAQENENTVTQYTVSMREVAIDVVGEINRLIDLNATVIQGHGDTSGKSARATRGVKLDLGSDECPIKQHRNRGIAGIPDSEPVSYTDFWVHQIIDALVAKGHLFALTNTNIHFYAIQA